MAIKYSESTGLFLKMEIFHLYYLCRILELPERNKSSC